MTSASPAPHADAISADCQVRQSEKADFSAIQALFVRAFNTTLLPARWDWKYAHAPCWGTVVERDNRTIGFFGGMPRLFKLHNQTILGVQIGDTMVDPAQRGESTRKGPFKVAAAAYFEQMDAIHPGAQFAFGFPPERVLALGKRLGLYAQIDRISIMFWKALPPRRNLFVKTRRINDWPDARQRQAVDRLWRAMYNAWPGLLLPVRDMDWLQHRYASHPEFRHDVLLVASRLTGRPLALAVVRAHADHLELMDYIGPAAGVELALTAARMHAGSLGLPTLQGWFSQRLTQIFNVGNPAIQESNIMVATNAWRKDRLPDTLKSPLWLMGGDSDYK